MVVADAQAPLWHQGISNSHATMIMVSYMNYVIDYDQLESRHS